MKRILSLLLSAIMLASALVSCAPAADQLDPAITLASSDAAAKAEWLDERLDTIPDRVVIGIGSNKKYGVDMSDFEDSGYITRAIGGDVLLFGATEDGLDRAVREYAKAADVGATAELDTVYGEGERIEKLTVGGHDISEFTVVCDSTEYVVPATFSKTIGNAGYAADEFIRLIEKATGVTLKKSTKNVSTPMVKIGYLADGSLGENGFSYKVENGNLYINGAGDANGCANGVYHFLEYQCGWEGLMYGDSILNEAELVEVKNGLSVSVDPMFDYLNHHGVQHLEYHGFGFENDRTAQKYAGIVAHASHGMSKNEWSGVNSNNLKYYQICYTDPNLFANTVDNIYSHVLEKNKAGEEVYYIDISQSDTFGYCLCSGCAKVYREEGKAHSGAVVRFANALAEEMASSGFPGIKYQIFAYHGSNIPCKTAPHEDVYVTVCNDGSCSNHKFDGSDCMAYSHDMAGYWGEDVRLNNTDYCQWLRGWSELTENVYLWHYIIDNNFGQYTAFDYLYEDISIFREIGIKGFYLEGESGGLGMGRVRHQIFEFMNYNPDATEEEYNLLLTELLRREYGDGYDFVLDYIGIWRETESTSGCWNCWDFNDLLCLDNYDQDIFRSRADEMLSVLEKAKDQANSLRQELNIKRLMMDVLYRQCAINYFNAVESEDTELLQVLEEKYDLFLQYLNENGYKLEAFPQAGTTTRSFELSDNLEDAAANEWAYERERLLSGALPYKYKHVVLIGVDGAGHAWQDAYTPWMDEIFAEGATTQRCRISSPTVSAPNWGTILTGVIPQLHGMENGDTEPYTMENYPTFFRLLREARPDATMACVTSWGSMPTTMIEPGLDVLTRTGSDVEVKDKAVQMIKAEQPELMFVYFGNVDHVGHDHGNSSVAYLNALYMVDDYIGQIYEALVEEGIADETLFMVTADHGHTRTGGHGGQTDDEVNVFFGAAGPGLIPNDDVEMFLLDVPAIVTHALQIEGNDDVWDSYIPAGFFADCPEGETRPDLVTTGKKVGETPTGNGALKNYVDTSKLETALFFDGNLNDSYGDREIISEGELSYEDGYYGSAASLTDESDIYSEDITFGTDSFSIGMWVKAEIKYMHSNVLYANKDHRVAEDSGFSFNYVGDTEFTAGNGSSGDLLYYGCPDGYHKSKWYHTLLVVDREAGTVSVYYNFKLCCTYELDSSLDGVSFDSGSPFVIGNDTIGDNGMTGLVDDLLIFNDALTEEEIQSLCGYYFK